MSVAIGDLLTVMVQLRDKTHGCPWDLQQDFHSIAPYAIEEAYELADAIERQDISGLKEELGDLLLQVVFHSQMAQEAGLFDFDDVVAGIADKMRRRHPHVFGDGKAANAAEVQKNWQDIKKDEKAQSGKNKGGVMADVPLALPALMRAQKIGNKARQAGFDWPEPAMDGAWQQLGQELSELQSARQSGNQADIEAELGDVLFCLANLAMRYGLDAEQSLRQTNHKFTMRFNYLENSAHAKNKSITDLSFNEKNDFWQKAKNDIG